MRYIVDSKKDLLAYEQLIWTPLRCLEDADKAIDDAYQRGLEDGKAVNDKGCVGCKFDGNGKDHSPCDYCCNGYSNQWQAKTDDEIKVGDEVTHKSDSVAWKAVCIQIDIDGRHMNLMGHTGAVGYYPVDDFKKTGRHFDIDKILDEMKGEGDK